jgi:hypothetical protein
MKNDIKVKQDQSNNSSTANFDATRPISWPNNLPEPFERLEAVDYVLRGTVAYDTAKTRRDRLQCAHAFTLLMLLGALCNERAHIQQWAEGELGQPLSNDGPCSAKRYTQLASLFTVNRPNPAKEASEFGDMCASITGEHGDQFATRQGVCSAWQRK